MCFPHLRKREVMDSPSKAKTASSAKSKPKKRYVKPELKKIPPSTAKAILEEKARGDSSAEKMLSTSDELGEKQRCRYPHGRQHECPGEWYLDGKCDNNR